MVEPVADIDFICPPPLDFDDIYLLLEENVPADLAKGFVPVYRFSIYNFDDQRLSYISFKVSDIEHITQHVGHIGFEVLPHYRGNQFARKACRALRPFIARYYRQVIITADVDNFASIRTIEVLGGEVYRPGSAAAGWSRAEAKNRSLQAMVLLGDLNRPYFV